MEFKTTRKAMVTFNAVSMTDIVLLLLVFFLLSSSFVIQPGIQVKLPQAETTEVQSERNIIVAVTARGEIYLNGQRINISELAVMLLHELSAGDDDTIIIRADQDIRVQQLVQIMDIAKSVGGSKFLIATQEVEN